MTRFQFIRTMQACADIVRRAAENPDMLDPLTTEWATFMLAANKDKLTQRRPAIEKVLALWDADLLAGLGTTEICDRIDQPRMTTLGALHRALQEGSIFGLVDKRNSLYFASRMARDAAMPAFEKARAARQLAKAKPLRIPRLAVKSELRPAQKKTKAAKPPKPPKEPTVTKPKHPKTKGIDLARKERTAFNPTDELKGKPPRTQKVANTAVYTPPHVKPIQCPSNPDNRFTPVLPAGGGLFSQDWAQARQTGVSQLVAEAKRIEA